MASSMMPWSKEPVTRLFTVADRCRNTSRRPGFTETEHCCRPLSREHCCRPVSSEDAPEDQLGHQLAPLKWAPFCACQAEQPRSRTQSCTGALSLARQSSNAASSNAPTQPCTLGINADVHVWSSPRHARLHGAMHSCTRFRGVPTTLHGQNSWPSSSCDMSGQAGLARHSHCLTCAK